MHLIERLELVVWYKHWACNTLHGADFCFHDMPNESHATGILDVDIHIEHAQKHNTIET